MVFNSNLNKMCNIAYAVYAVYIFIFSCIISALLDIPVYKSKVQSLHVLFTLYSEFKNSQVCILSDVVINELFEYLLSNMIIVIVLKLNLFDYKNLLSFNHQIKVILAFLVMIIMYILLENIIISGMPGIIHHLLTSGWPSLA